MHRAVLLTGGNMGDREGLVARACELILQRVGNLVVSSSVYESVAWGFECENCFINQVIVVDTQLAPMDLLDCTQQIERELGRIRGESAGYASRTMDIDLLFYDDLVLNLPRLTIPHPLICEREFVLKPLREVYGDFFHPVIRKKISDL